MVIISAMCYKPIKMDSQSIKRYLWKRFLRIYIPVFIFVNLFYGAILCIEAYTGKNVFSVYTYVGSLLLLNSPSIGYVWIMRVFLMMAFVLPFAEPLFRKLKPLGLTLILYLLIIFQECVIEAFTFLPDNVLKFILAQIIPYTTGYLVFTAIGLRVMNFSFIQKIFLSVAAMTGCVAYFWLTCNLNPQIDKYPPHGLYLLWGWCGSMLLIVCKPVFEKITQWSIWSYLSRNSMWIYLWHIVPVYLITPVSIRPDIWLVRYILVLSVALLLNYIYHLSIAHFSKEIRKYIG